MGTEDVKVTAINMYKYKERLYPELLICFEFTIRELKLRQRRQQRERHKFAYLVGKNNSFARPARAFLFLFISLPSSAKRQREMTKFEVL